MHEILESGDLEQALADCEQRPANALFSATVNNELPPSFEALLAGPEALALYEPELRN